MKKIAKIAAFVCCAILALALAGCQGAKKSYDEQIAALSANPWYFELEAVNALYRISFDKDAAEYDYVFYDGNGIHQASDKANTTFTIDDNNIVVKESGEFAELTIPYTFENGTITLDSGKFRSPDMILAELQGNWTMEEFSFGAGEYNLNITGNHIEYENANKSAVSWADYFYYGPYSGDFTLGFGTFEGDIKHLNTYFFMISDNVVVPTHFANKMHPGDGLKGEDGYSF